MKRFSLLLCAGLALAAPALAAPTPVAKGDLKSGGATWNVSSADSLTRALVVDLVKAPPKRPLADKDVLAAGKLYLKGQKSLKGCAVSGAPQPIAWADNSVWVLSLGCK